MSSVLTESFPVSSMMSHVLSLRLFEYHLVFLNTIWLDLINQLKTDKKSLVTFGLTMKCAIQVNFNVLHDKVMKTLVVHPRFTHNVLGPSWLQTGLMSTIP